MQMILGLAALRYVPGEPMMPWELRTLFLGGGSHPLHRSYPCVVHRNNLSQCLPLASPLHPASAAVNTAERARSSQDSSSLHWGRFPLREEGASNGDPGLLQLLPQLSKSGSLGARRGRASSTFSMVASEYFEFH